MTNPPPRPTELKLLCFAILLWSALSIAAQVPHWQTIVTHSSDEYTINFDLGIFGFLAAIGLWRFSSLGRRFAVVITWYWLIGSVFLFLELFGLRFFGITFHASSTTHFFAGTPRSVLRALVIPFFFSQVWQISALRRPHLLALFAPRPAPPPLPQSPAASTSPPDSARSRTEF
jgi:hypothetical protein